MLLPTSNLIKFYVPATPHSTALASIHYSSASLLFPAGKMLHEVDDKSPKILG